MHLLPGIQSKANFRLAAFEVSALGFGCAFGDAFGPALVPFPLFQFFPPFPAFPPFPSLPPLPAFPFLGGASTPEEST